jgi:hypothetical protein
LVRVLDVRKSHRIRKLSRKMVEASEAVHARQLSMSMSLPVYVEALHLQQSAGVKTTGVSIPAHYGAAMASPQRTEWTAATQKEYDGFLLRQVFDWVKLSTLPTATHILGCQWVFDIKRCFDGTIARFKARLVVRGDQQQYGVDFTETFSAVVKSTTLRLLLSIAAAQNLVLHHVDVVQAFLCADLEETVYVRPPPGVDAPAGYVWKLRKSLYGLKQAPRVFNIS